LRANEEVDIIQEYVQWITWVLAYLLMAYWLVIGTKWRSANRRKAPPHTGSTITYEKAIEYDLMIWS